MEVGELTISGKLDTSEIEQGFNRIESNIKDLDVQNQQANTSFKSLAGNASKFAKSLIAIGGAGLTAMTALATKSPVLAGTMAKIQVATLKLSNTIGKQMKPIFESTIGFIQDLDQALLNNESVIGKVSSGISTGIGDLGSAIKGEWSKIENLVPKGAGAAAGIALGVPFGLKGMMLGAILGAAAGDAITPEVTPENEKFGLFGESMTAADNVGDVWNEIFEDKHISGPELFKLGKSGFVAGSNAIFDAIEWIFSKTDNKNQNFAIATGGSR